MDHSSDAMKLALRVLSALGEKQDPSRQDILELVRLAPEKALDDTGELACEVIKRALKHGAEIRAKKPGTM
jgi:hypothetical protein